MDTARNKASPCCLVFLHPAAASNPQIIREIHAATGLQAVISGDCKAAMLTRSNPDTGPWPGGDAA